MDSFSPFPTINGTATLETVRSPQYRWNSLGRGEQPEIILQRTLTGEGRVRVGKEIHCATPGRVFIVAVPEDAEYWFDASPGQQWTFQWINLGGAWMRDSWLELRRQFGVAPMLDLHGTAARNFGLLTADFLAHRLQSPRLQAEACHGLLLDIWLELDGKIAPPSKSSHALHSLIQLRHREPVNIKELCASLGQSREHLTRVFQQEWKMEPATYLRNLRLEAAEIYLRHGTASLDDIARRVGFGSGRQLARAFQASRGSSPTEYRTRLHPHPDHSKANPQTARSKSGLCLGQKSR